MGVQVASQRCTWVWPTDASPPLSGGERQGFVHEIYRVTYPVARMKVGEMRWYEKSEMPEVDDVLSGQVVMKRLIRSEETTKGIDVGIQKRKAKNI